MRYIAVAWAFRHVKSRATQLFVKQIVPANNIEDITTYNNIEDIYIASHYWLFVRGILQWQVDSPHKGLVMQMFPCHDVIMAWMNVIMARIYEQPLDRLWYSINAGVVTLRSLWLVSHHTKHNKAKTVCIWCAGFPDWLFNSLRPRDAYMHQ